MIIVRRVIHKKTTSFGLFTPEQLGQTFQCNFAKQSYRGISDPWDEPFSRKVDPKGNPKMPSFQRLLGSGAEPGIPRDTPRPQPPNTATNSKTVTKPGSNSKAVLAGLAAAGLVGAGAYFIRRRRSSKGKQIIERVRR